MRPSSEKLQAALAEISLSAPEIPVIGNVMAKELKDVATIQQELVEQVYSAVQWEASMREMLAQGVDVFIECGLVKY